MAILQWNPSHGMIRTLSLGSTYCCGIYRNWQNRIYKEIERDLIQEFESISRNKMADILWIWALISAFVSELSHAIATWVLLQVRDLWTKICTTDPKDWFVHCKDLRFIVISGSIQSMEYRNIFGESV